MVKIPNLNDLKKMGSDFVESAKSSIENVGQTLNKKNEEQPQPYDPNADSNPVREQFRQLYAAIKELKEIEAKQMDLTRKVELQLSALAKIFEAHTKTESTPKENK